MTDKLRVLLLATNQLEVEYIRVGDELRKIEQKVQGALFCDFIEAIAKPAVRLSDLGGTLLRSQPHVIHFSGHGEPSEGIFFEDESGNAKPVNEDEMTDILRVLKAHLRLVCFNVCFSQSVAKAVTREIDYAIGMEGALEDDAAIIFAAAFYEMLAFGRSVNDAFAVARNLAGSPHPVLYIKPGVDADEPFLQQTRAIEGLRQAAQRLLKGTASEADREKIRQGVSDGQILLAEIEEVELPPEKIRRKATSLTMRDGQLHITLPESAYRQTQKWLYPTPPGIAPPFHPSLVIGREEAKQDLKRLLESARMLEGHQKITVVRGWPGVGKTTLVGVIGHDPEIARLFPQGVLWVSLEQKPDLLSKLMHWGQALGTEEIWRASTLDDAIVQLAALLEHRQMLLIVDDVWMPAHAIPFIKALSSRSALMITTRMPIVANEVTLEGGTVYNLPVLDKESALALLRILVPDIVVQYEEACRELIHDLEYLPLALHVAGRLLKSEAHMGWGITDLIEEIRTEARIIQEQAPKDRIEGDKIPTVSALLMKSTAMLDEDTRECFAFLGAFAPKPAIFDLDAMQGVWNVKNAKPIVRKLVDYGLLEPLGEGHFQMHRILVEHALSLCTP